MARKDFCFGDHLSLLLFPYLVKELSLTVISLTTLLAPGIRKVLSTNNQSTHVREGEREGEAAAAPGGI